MVKIYDLVDGKGGHFSPYAWRALLALKHKGIDFEHIGLTFLQIQDQIPKLSNGEWNKIPLVIFDDNKVLYDSGPIADYLEVKYPNNSLFPNGKAYSNFITSYLGTYSKPLFQLVCMNIYNSISDEDKTYFRKAREEMFQTTLEDLTSQPEAYYIEVEKLFQPFRATLKTNRYLEATFSDYILFGHIMWIYVCAKPVFDRVFANHEDSTLKNFFDDVSSLFGGYVKQFQQ